jgi:choline-sulfatase
MVRRSSSSSSSSSSWLAVLGATALLALGQTPSAGATWGGSAAKLKLDDFKGKNVIVLIIDQQRQIQDFPPGWSEANLPGLTRLQANGLTFNQATCNAAMCSPSRATLFTGRFPAQHGVRWVLEENMPNTTYAQMEMPRPDQLDNMATMAINAGYEAVFKGKFHLIDVSGGVASSSIENRRQRLCTTTPPGPRRPFSSRHLH